MKHFTVLVLAIILSPVMRAQLSGLSYLYNNYSNMLPERSYKTEDGKKYNDPQYYSHPDFGKLTFEAPIGKSVVEDISKRTLDQRYYIDVNDPLFFYIEKSTKPINYYKNGLLMAIDPSLKQSSAGIYNAFAQPCATELNTLQKRSGIALGNEYFGFNNFSVRVEQNNGSTQLLTSDWSNIVVGNNGAYITNVFPGIDMKIMYREASVKSEFIIKQNLNVKKLVFIDQLQVSNNLSLQLETSMINDRTKGHLIVFDNQVNDQVAVIEPARTHDNSGSKTSWINLYTLIGNNLEILCDSSVLNGAQTIYPVTVDPLVTAVGPIVAGTTFLSGSLVTPAFCSNTIAVTYPGGTTPWDVSIGWSVYSNWCFGYYTGNGALGDDCWNSEAQINITSSCGGRSPAGALIWTCLGCNSPGTWAPTVAFASSGTQSLAQCYTGSCAAQTMSFTINFNRTNCASYSNYDGCTPTNRSYCQTLDNWRVTVQGRNMETLGNTTSGNGTAAVSATCYVPQTLNPTPAYGIGPYTYLWTPGGQTTSTRTVSTNYIGTQTFSCTVVDACGTTTRVAVFNVSTNCVLPVELLDFTATVEGKSVNLLWQTATESNSSHFIIERSYDGINFVTVSTVKAAGKSLNKRSYMTTDYNADLTRIVYYRLRQFDVGSDEARFTSLISIESKAEKSMDIFPNPGSGIYLIVPSGKYAGKLYDLSVYDHTGKEILKRSGIMDTSNIDIEASPAGIYLVKININGQVINKNIVKQ